MIEVFASAASASPRGAQRQPLAHHVGEPVQRLGEAAAGAGSAAPKQWRRSDIPANWLRFGHLAQRILQGHADGDPV